MHRIYQARAAAAGLSLQAYLLTELAQNAARRTPAELMAEVEERLRIEGEEGFATVSSAEVVAADRQSH